MPTMYQLCLITVLAPLAGALVSGLLCLRIGHRAAHAVTVLGMAVSCAAAFAVLAGVLRGEGFSGAALPLVRRRIRPWAS